jgi:hypothetical protein
MALQQRAQDIEFQGAQAQAGAGLMGGIATGIGTMMGGPIGGAAANALFSGAKGG